MSHVHRLGTVLVIDVADHGTIDDLKQGFCATAKQEIQALKTQKTPRCAD